MSEATTPFAVSFRGSGRCGQTMPSGDWKRLVSYGDAVIALSRFSGHARASEAEITGGVFAVYRFRDGKIAQIEDFTDRAHALAAVGAEE